MIRLWHGCGTSVDYAHGQQGIAYVALFADPQTDDPLTHCTRCGKDLYGALRDGEFRCTAPGIAVPPRSTRYGRTRPLVPATQTPAHAGKEST